MRCLSGPGNRRASVGSPLRSGGASSASTRTRSTSPFPERVACGPVRRRSSVDSCRRRTALLRDVAVTGLALTSLHAAVALGAAGPEMLDRALQTRVRFADVRAAHYRNLGCHGSHDAGLLLIAAGDRAAAQSERRFIRVMKESGIGGWRANQLVRVASLSRTCDFVFVRERVIVEIDGWAWHHTAGPVQRRPVQAERIDERRLAGAPVHLARSHPAAGVCRGRGAQRPGSGGLSILGQPGAARRVAGPCTRSPEGDQRMC